MNYLTFFVPNSNLGIRILKVDGLFEYIILPLCDSMIVWQLDNPSPVPFCFVVNRGLNIFSRFSSGTPFPESEISITVLSLIFLPEITISPLSTSDWTTFKIIFVNVV